MKKISFLALLVSIGLAAGSMTEAQAQVLGEVKTQVTANEISYTGSKFPVGQTVYSDDLSDTMVTVSGDGNPYQIQTVQNYRLNLVPSSLSGAEWVKNMARISIVKDGVPEAVLKADGIMGWHIKKATSSELRAELYISMGDGKEATLIHRVYHANNGWYSVYMMGEGTVTPENLLAWIGPEKSY